MSRERSSRIGSNVSKESGGHSRLGCSSNGYFGASAPHVLVVIIGRMIKRILGVT